MENQENGRVHVHDLPVNHPSHDHPLKLTRTKVNAPTTKITCSGCKNPISQTGVDFHYACTNPNCPFALHKPCFAGPDRDPKVNGDDSGLLEMISASYAAADKSTPSQNFSDSCFSLDLADQVVVVGPQCHNTKSTPGFDKTMSRGSESNMSSKLLLGGGGPNEIEFGSGPKIQTEAASSKRSSCWPFC